MDDDDYIVGKIFVFSFSVLDFIPHFLLKISIFIQTTFFQVAMIFELSFSCKLRLMISI